MATNAQWKDVSLDTFIDRSMITNLVGFIPNQIFFVDSSQGASTNDGLTRSAPLATVAQAVAKCTASKGDVICIAAGHAETLAATTQGVALSVAGVTYLGFGNARNRPTLTCGAADIVGVLLSGNNCVLRNLIIVGSTSQTTATSFALHVTGTDNTIQDCEIRHGGAGPLRAAGMTGASRTVWKNTKFVGTSAGPDASIFIVTNSRGSQYRDLVFEYTDSAGLDSGAVMGSAGIDTAGSIFSGCIGLNMDLTLFDINGSHASWAVGDSVMINNVGQFRAAVTIANSIDAGGNILLGNWLADAVASPAITTGAIGAITTASQRVPSGSPVT